MSGGDVTAARSCANCAAPLVGKYCSACGQRHEQHLHSLGEFIGEATESVTHADSRVWRTLWPLIAKPGFLTREFCEGRRARYLPPFRLYLVLSVVFFLVAASGSHTWALVQLGEKDGAPTVGVEKLDTPTVPEETPQQRAARICDDASIGVVGSTALEPRLRRSCRGIVMDEGRGLARALYHNIPRALFVLLPLLALVMRLMYLRRYYVEHLLFFVHNHAFTFLLFTIYVLAIRWIDRGWLFGLITAAVVLATPYYTYRAMLRVYGQGRWATRAKFAVLSLAYVTCVLIMAILTSLYTVVTL